MIQIHCSSVVSANRQGGKKYTGLMDRIAAWYAPLYYLSHLFSFFFFFLKSLI